MSRQLHDGREDQLVPLESLSLDEITSFSELLRAMSRTAFSGRQLGEALDVLLAMAGDPDCGMILTLSGAMTVAKQGRIICDMIDRGLVQGIVATGALMAHGLTESIGLTHYRHDPRHNDEELFQKGYNRIYDTLEMEANLNDVETLIKSVLREGRCENGVWSSAKLCRELGRALHQRNEGPAILQSAFEKNVPVFLPAFTDSEIGLDVAIAAIRGSLAESAKQNPDATATANSEAVFSAVPSFNPFLDLQQYARLIGEQKTLGIFTIGGGVPRNWAQQVGPYYDIVNDRCGTNLPQPRFKYAVRICPEPVHWGGLSGCTYSEGVSWGKFVSPTEGGRFAEVFADATVAWPLLMKAVFEELDKDE